MPQTGTYVLLIFLLLVAAVLLVLLQLTRLGYLVRTTIPDRPRRRLFLASVAFFVSFLSVRLVVYFVVRGRGPFHWVTMGGRHIHHLVWGILILLFVGYGWLLDLGRAHSPLSILLSRIMCIAYGVGAALTLDEFTLWLNLDPDLYWARAGRLSIDVVVLFGSVLMIGAWGAPFFQGLQRLWTKGGMLRTRVGRPIRRVRWPRRRKGPRSMTRSVD
ncbi:hypothetical protein ACFPT7_21310 [Acidicapsa dinghuensis]|uniref:Integral membrane protein n=1 Tax=Acidicapsa dinghuensis TaxID=2218256 RepID=A0ABW1EKU9_9BACT|nr:hypothetical protein [Acidicapsa dinghuensis]